MRYLNRKSFQVAFAELSSDCPLSLYRSVVSAYIVVNDCIAVNDSCARAPCVYLITTISRSALHLLPRLVEDCLLLSITDRR